MKFGGPLQPFCGVCDGRHGEGQCRSIEAPISKAPLETPPHNGIYLGPVPVRVIPRGVAAGDADPWQKKAETGHQVQSRLARERAGMKSRQRKLTRRKP